MLYIESISTLPTLNFTEHELTFIHIHDLTIGIELRYQFHPLGYHATENDVYLLTFELTKQQIANLLEEIDNIYQSNT